MVYLQIPINKSQYDAETNHLKFISNQMISFCITQFLLKGVFE